MGKKAPKTPDLKPITDAQLALAASQERIAAEAMGLSREQFAFMKEQSLAEIAFARQQADRNLEFQERALATDRETADMARRVGETQIGAMEQSMDYARRDRARYEDTFLPMEDRLISEANAYDTPERREMEAGRAIADNQRMLEAQRANTEARLAGMGVDPSQVRSTSLSAQIGAAGAAAGALAANNARTTVEERGRALRADAVNLGRGLPSQVAQGVAMGTNAGNSAVGAAQAGQGATLGALGAASGFGNAAIGQRQGALGAYANFTGSPMQWHSMSQGAAGMQSNSLMNSASLLNQDYQNRVDRFNNQMNQFNNTVGMAASVAGAFMAEGGKVKGAMKGAMKGGAKDKAATARRREIGSALLDVGSGMVSEPQSTGGRDVLPAITMYPQQPYMAEGGTARLVPRKQSRDGVMAMLAEGEYVIPADVVDTKGVEFFDKLVARHHRAGA